MSKTPLSTTTDRDGGSVIVRVRGEVDMNSAPELSRALSDAAAQPSAEGVVVDLTEVTFFASGGLTVLLGAHERAVASSVPLTVVAGVADVARRILDITGATRVLTVVDAIA